MNVSDATDHAKMLNCNVMALQHSKPDPDLLLSSLRKMNLSAEEVVMLGDTPYDMESASKIGMRAVGVRY